MKRSKLEKNATLSYLDINLDLDGYVLSREQIKQVRIRLGFCTHCEGVPIRLFHIQNRIPIWKNKIEISAVGESLDGQCLRCNPHLDPNYKTGRERPSNTSVIEDIIFTPPNQIASSSPTHFEHDSYESIYTTSNTTCSTDSTESSTESTESKESKESTITTIQEDDICLSEISSIIKDASVSGDTALPISILISYTKVNSNNPTAQEYFLGKVWDLCKESDEYKTNFLSNHVIEYIIQAMKKFGNIAIIQEQACGLISALCTSKERRKDIVRAGVTNSILMALINNIDDENLVATAVGCLRTISSEGEARECIAAMSGMEYVCKAMKLHLAAADIQRDGCNILSNCAVDTERQEVAIMTECEVKAITDALFVHKNQPSVISGGLFAIKNFSFREQNVRRLILVNGFIELLENVNQHCAFECRDSSIVLEIILQTKINDECLENQVLESIFQIADVPEKVIDLMQDYDWSSKILASVFHIHTLLLQQYPEQGVKIDNRRVIGNIITTMKRFKTVASIQTNGCKLLNIIAMDNVDARRNILDIGGCQVLMTAIKSHLENAVILDAATNALKTLSTELKCLIQLQQSELFLNRVGTENYGILKIQENCQGIINKISRHQVY